MALSFTKKKPTEANSGAGSQPPQTDTATTKSPDKSSQGSSSGKGWLKTGKEAHTALAHEQAKADAAKAEAGKMYRFFVPDNEERQISFLDGELDNDGMLDIPMFYEHVLKINGDMTNFVCLAQNGEDSVPCPICERGDKEGKNRLVGVLTIIDHTPYKIKNGQNAGKIIQNTRKLFVATRQTIQLLTKTASKRGGLTGCTFDVSRTGDNSPGVGNQFDFVTKHPNLEALAAKYGLEMKDVQPANYEKEITRHTAQEMVDLGAGKAITGPGYSTASKSALKDNL